MWTVSLALGGVRLDDGHATGRSSVVSIRGSDYVWRPQALGASSGRILVRPSSSQCACAVLIYATIAVGTFISAEAALTYLGIGLQAPEIFLGIADQRRAIVDRQFAAPVLFFPALFLSFTVLGFILSATLCATPSTRSGVDHGRTASPHSRAEHRILRRQEVGARRPGHRPSSWRKARCLLWSVNWQWQVDARHVHPGLFGCQRKRFPAAYG